MTVTSGRAGVCADSTLSQDLDITLSLSHEDDVGGPRTPLCQAPNADWRDDRDQYQHRDQGTSPTPAQSTQHPSPHQRVW